MSAPMLTLEMLPSEEPPNGSQMWEALSSRLEANFNSWRAVCAELRATETEPSSSSRSLERLRQLVASPLTSRRPSASLPLTLDDLDP